MILKYDIKHNVFNTIYIQAVAGVVEDEFILIARVLIIVKYLLFLPTYNILLYLIFVNS